MLELCHARVTGAGTGRSYDSRVVATEAASGIRSSEVEAESTRLGRLCSHVFDPGHAALEAAARAAVVVPALLAVCDRAIGDAAVALFAVFAALAVLVFVDFGGDQRARFAAYAGLALAGLPLIALGTLCSRSAWLAALVMAVVGFAILFAGVVDAYIAASSTAALLAFVLPVMVPAPAAEIPDRLGGWALGSATGIVALRLLWPGRPHDRLRADIAAAVRALAGCVDTLASGDWTSAGVRVRAAEAAVVVARRTFVATPYRPTGATGRAAALAYLVNDAGWLLPAVQPAPAWTDHAYFERERAELASVSGDVLRAAATAVERGFERPALGRLEQVRRATRDVFRARVEEAVPARDEVTLTAMIDEVFRLRLLSYGAEQIGAHAVVAAGDPEPRLEEPTIEIGQPRTAVARVLGDFASLRSVWFRNSLRGAVGLALAVLLGQLADLQHAFWVVLGVLSVLRSNALGTGSTALRALAGTTVGIGVGGALIAGIGSNENALWAILPVAILLAAYAPRAVSFAAGQAGFTIAVLVLFDLLEPTSWKIGLVRVEDIAIGGAISIGVGVLFWPRGAAAVLRQSVATAYATSVDWLAAAIETLLVSGERERLGRARRQATAAARRLDDAFRQYLAERSRGHRQLDSLAVLTAGAIRVCRLAYALEAGHLLWSLAPQESGPAALVGARARLAADLDALRSWYAALGEAVVAGRRGPEPLPEAAAADGAAPWLRELARRGGEADLALGLAVVWTGKYLELLRSLQPRLAAAATAIGR